MGTLTISAKCSDLCFASFTDDNGKTIEHDGYVPSDIGIGGNDYVELEIDTKRGRILGWKPLTDAEVKKALS